MAEIITVNYPVSRGEGDCLDEIGGITAALTTGRSAVGRHISRVAYPGASEAVSTQSDVGG